MNEMLAELPSNDEISGRVAEAIDHISVAYTAITIGLAGKSGTWRDLHGTSSRFVSRWIHVVAGFIWAVLVAVIVVRGVFSSFRHRQSKST
ncbi:hypothetical protein [Bradyrhizobium liaoningense]|uniref:hypothetical protein n=1 Tax=Bradyrhizobium liaoningense TaxID=43992 RepID=UPI001BA60C68|nr:hypothetical protein [Bradyrhizobium liaoningense]MBR1167482.1 hypothetical protein [Bradyrhizobium liaoningense]